MCKTLRTYEWSWVFDYFLCSSYRYIICMHSRSNLYHSNVSSTHYVSKKYLNNLTSKIPNCFILTFQIQQNYLAPVGFLQELDFCRIWKKCRIPAGAEIRCSPSSVLKMLTFLVPNYLLFHKQQLCRTYTTIDYVFNTDCIDSVTNNVHIMPSCQLAPCVLHSEEILANITNHSTDEGFGWPRQRYTQELLASSVPLLYWYTMLTVNW